MPIYAFECDSCRHSFDRLQRLADADPTECPQCGQSTVRRQLTAPSFRLAGSGWYETDFKKDGDKKRNLAKSDEAPKLADSAPAKADSKAPTKPTPAPAAAAKSSE